MDYIILGTYKTKPEEMGWFISKKYQFLFWDTISKRFDIDDLTVKSIDVGTEKYKRKIGVLITKNGDRIIFYDLLNYSSELSRSRIFNDKQIFSSENYRKIMLDGVDYFINKFLFEYCDNNVKIGMIGSRTFGLILNKVKGLDYTYKTIKSYENQINWNDPSESLRILNDKFGQQTIRFYHLFPITGIFKYETFKKDNSWNNFYSNKM